MLIAILACVAAAGYIGWLKNENKRTDKALEAFDEFHSLQSWIIKHRDDCFMSDAKWRDLLPQCRITDSKMRMFKTKYMTMTDTCEALVRRIINDGEEEPDEASV
jgi:hypothetical protein